MSDQTRFLKDIPNDWRSDRMGNVAEILFSNVDKHTFDSEIPVRLCNYVDVYKNDRITSDIEFMEASAEPREIARFQIQKGDVLATKDSETPDDIAIPSLVAETLPGVLCGYHLALIRPKAHQVYGEYLAWLHCSKAFRSHYEAQAVGVTRFGLSQAAFKEARVPLPPLPEQQRIAAYLDASCAAIDAAVATKRHQLETLARLKKAIITQAVTYGIAQSVEKKPSGKEWIGEIPRHWKVEKLKYLTSLIVDGTHITPTYIPDGIPFLRVTDIQDEAIDLSEVKYVSPEEHELLSKRVRARRGDILLSKNGTIGIVKVVDWDWEFSFFVSLCLIRPEKVLNPLYFSFFFESSVVEQQLFESSKKTSVTNLHLVKIRELLICVPPPDEQSEIVHYLRSRCSDLMTVARNIESQITTLTAYRKSLIHECVTGQRRITEADLNRVESHG